MPLSILIFVDNNEGFSCDISGNDINTTDSYIKGSAYNYKY